MDKSALCRHWFFLPASAIVSGAIIVTRTVDWQMEARLVEAALLFDLAVLLPALYFWCYRSPTRPFALRAVAFSCAGFWVASFLVPSEHHGLLDDLSWVRYFAIGVLLYVELRVLAVLYWSVIAGHKTPESAAADFAAATGMPAQIAGLLAGEAAFWKRLLREPLRLIRRFRRQ